MLKQLTAMGIATAGIAGGMLLASPANAESRTAKHNACFAVAPYVALPPYCNLPSVQYPAYNYYPGHRYGWQRWHHHPWYRYGF